MPLFFEDVSLDAWTIYIIVKVIVSLPIAYYAKRKGYNYWSFLIAGVLFSPLACIAILLALPKIVRYVNEDEAEAQANS